jgi:DNA gyrase subunit B
MKDSMIEEILALTALEAIRSRPRMYVGPDHFGPVSDQLLQSAMCHPLAELSCGSATRVDVSIDGLSAVIADDGPGWPVHPIGDGRRFAERLLSDLYACRDHNQHADLAHSLCRITLPVVVALSKVFTLDVRREGEHWQQVYRSGVADGPLTLTGRCETSGTTLSFSLEPEFCDGTVFSAEAFSTWIDGLAAQVPVASVHLHQK